MQNQFLLFDELVLDAPDTEGIKYAGSKLKLLSKILELTKMTDADSIFDGFSGSTRVSQAFARCGYQVVSNDLSEWSSTFGFCYLKNKKEAETYNGLIEHLNNLAPVDGWFTEHYGGDVFNNALNNGVQSDGSKKPWQRKNTRKLDAIRTEIDNLGLDEVTKAVALTSLIIALDKVDSTLGHFVSYLKDWSPRSFNDLKLLVPALWVNERENTVLQGDVFKSLPSVNCDLAYYDPPYGSNNEKMPPSRVRYASYYHVWATIIKNDRPNLFGKALRREDTSDKVANSVFEEFRKNNSGRFIVVEVIEELIKKTPCEWIVLSYSSGGRATAEELNEVIQENGTLIDTVEVAYKKNVMAAMKWTNEWLREAEEPNREFLFLIRKK
ncbi:MAG: Modification methylase FokI [Verrucomicrobia subdivision 3 bacterium]|nr:Modification methylase FokI [Limisphaerales bacterium]MCS1417424.1 Modification methylase FokI [Limisphaerales bacterium]